MVIYRLPRDRDRRSLDRAGAGLPDAERLYERPRPAGERLSPDRLRLLEFINKRI